MTNDQKTERHMTKSGVYEIIGSELRKDRDINESLREISQRLAISYGQAVERNVSAILRVLISSQSRSDVIRYAENRTLKAFDVLTTQREENDRFDDLYGTETSTIYEQLELPDAISVGRVIECSRCHPSPVQSVRNVLDSLKTKEIKYQDYVFIDIGSGLGRNLLIASNYGFKRVIGVEISNYLCQKSLTNITKYQCKHPNISPIEVCCVNALDYALPDDNMVLYFWEPFGRRSSDLFHSKIANYLSSHKKKVILIFLNFQEKAFTADSNAFRLLHTFRTEDNTDSNDKRFMVSVFENVH